MDVFILTINFKRGGGGAIAIANHFKSIGYVSLSSALVTNSRIITAIQTMFAGYLFTCTNSKVVTSDTHAGFTFKGFRLTNLKGDLSIGLCLHRCSARPIQHSSIFFTYNIWMALGVYINYF